MADTLNYNTSVSVKGRSMTSAKSVDAGRVYDQDLVINTAAYIPVTTGSLITTNNAIFIKNNTSQSTVVVALDSAGTNKVSLITWNEMLYLNPVAGGTFYISSSSATTASITVFAVE